LNKNNFCSSIGCFGKSLLISHKCSIKFNVEWYDIKLISFSNFPKLIKSSALFSSYNILCFFSSFSSPSSTSIISSSSLIISGVDNLKLLISIKNSSGFNFLFFLTLNDLIFIFSSSSISVLIISLLFFNFPSFFNLLISFSFSLIYSFWEKVIIISRPFLNLLNSMENLYMV